MCASLEISKRICDTCILFIIVCQRKEKKNKVAKEVKRIKQNLQLAKLQNELLDAKQKLTVMEEEVVSEVSCRDTSTEEGNNDTKMKWADFNEMTLCTSNNTLVEKWVKDHLKATETTRLADLTNGEGTFTKNIKNSVIVIPMDKFKNKNAFPDEYPDVFSLDEKVKELTRKKVDIVILDPPYYAEGNGHDSLNCSYESSESFIQKNGRYGVAYPYKDPMILEMYFDLIRKAKSILLLGGHMMVKFMDSDTLKLSALVPQIGKAGGIISFPQIVDDTSLTTFLLLHKAYHNKFEPVGQPTPLHRKRGKTLSTLQIFKRIEGNTNGGACLIERFAINQAHTLMKSIESKAKEDANKSYINSSISDLGTARKWCRNAQTIKSKLEPWRAEIAEKGVPAELRSLISALGGEEEELFQLRVKDVTGLGDDTDQLQRKAFEMYNLRLDSRILAAFYWEQYLLMNRVRINQQNSLPLKKVLAKGLNLRVGTESLTGKRHTSLSQNNIWIKKKKGWDMNTPNMTIDHYFGHGGRKRNREE